MYDSRTLGPVQFQNKLIIMVGEHSSSKNEELQAAYVYVTGQNYIQIKIFKPRLVLNFLCLLALIHE